MYSGVECSSCSSKNRRKFNGELALHLPGLEGLDKPIVWAFPEVLLCLDCGFAAFVLENDPLKEAREVYADADSSETSSFGRAV